MKKIVSLVLALLMLMSLFSVSVFAEEEEKSELISFEQTNRKETRHFTLTADSYDSYGWRGGDNNQKITISAKDSNIIITRVEAVIGFYGYVYNCVGTNGGEKREKGTVKDGDTVHIDNINSDTFSFSRGSNNVKFKDITVYYTVIHSYGEDNKCTVCGKTKCEIEGHSYGSDYKCTICGKLKCEAEDHSYNENNTCIYCGLIRCEIEGQHSYKDGFCTFCGQKYVEEKSELISFEQTNRKETEHFLLTADSHDGDGWRGGDNSHKLTITSRGSNIIITRVEAVIWSYGPHYSLVGVSCGNKREQGKVYNYDTVHIDNINSNTFSFSGGSTYAQFKDITVYYKDTNASDPIENGYYIIRSAVDPNYCLDISGGSNAKSEGDNLHLWPVDGAQAKIFEIKKDGNAYKIIAAHSGMALDVAGNTTGEGVNIYQWTDYGTNNQRWIFKETSSENCYYIHSALVGQAIWMDAAGCIDGAMPKEDTNVQVWSYTGNPNQMWILEKVEAPTTGSTISEGNIWIVAAIGAVAVIAIAAVVVAKKKKKPALAEGTDNTNEE